MRTWQFELVFVAAGLGFTFAASGGGKVEAVGSLAVLAGFAHAQVADRLAEAAKKTDGLAWQMDGQRALTHCWRWSRRYYVSKELLWLAYFTSLRAWSALAGVFIFLAYPAWRAAYRRWL